MKYIALPLAVIVMFVVLNIIAWVGFFWGYHVFTHEEPILTLRFEEAGEREYMAHIESPRSIRGEYPLYGDQWRIDSRFVKMKYWAHLFGSESRYAIDRLQGRYIDIQEENSLPNIAHQLNGEGITHFTIFGWNPFIDTEYGSSTYQTIDPKKRFTLYKTPAGIMVRSETISSEVEESWFERLW